MIFLLEEKTCRAEVFCTEQQHSMAEAGGEKFPLVFAFVGEYTQKLHDSLKEETFEKLDTQMTQILEVNRNLAEKVVNLQKDTAIIMETLQLILTNMMLNKVPDQIDSSKN